MFDSKREGEYKERENPYEFALQFYKERLEFYKKELEEEYRLGKIFGFAGRGEKLEAGKEAHRKAVQDTVEFFEELFGKPEFGKTDRETTGEYSVG